MSEQTETERPGNRGDSVLVAGPIRVDLERHEARLDGREIVFSHRELLLLAYLIRQGGRVASTEEISDAVWGKRSVTNTVAVHVKRVRVKLGDDPQHGNMIRTVRGVGYRLGPSLCS
ncbi:winged helix-turn-helix domain-containing protein [Pseudarthrobacter sp. 1C304]|uniref:winged helix-turn-helix domain-containing protein n=1 Tax=Pseudarthrobacter sp. 1C304 TaxID=3457438 RepID=UPI003FD2FE5E